MVSVTIIDRSSGHPLKNVKVGIAFTGFFGGVTSDEWTDSNGEVHFDNDPGEGKIYVKGNEEFRGYISGNKIIYI